MTSGESVKPYNGGPLQGHSGHEVKVVGKVDVDIEYGAQQVQLPLLIVEGEHTAIC